MESKDVPQEPHKKKYSYMDITMRFFDSYTRSMDSLKKSFQAISDKFEEQDAVVNFGIGHVEDKKLTQGISQGAMNNGVYAIQDLIYNPNHQEYLAITKYGELSRFDWAGNPLSAPRLPSKTFSRFIYVNTTGHYICWNPRKSSFFLTKDDFSIVIDSVALAPIGNIIYGGRKNEDSFDFFIICEATLNRYCYHPTSNVISLQDCLKLSDVEADGAVIEQTCFDNPTDDRKQWIYCTFNSNCCIIDVTGRVHGTKRNLHETRLTAIMATGSSEFVVTGDDKGLLKLWGTRWAYITEIQAHHNTRVTHLIEHPSGRASISFGRDQTLLAWSFDTQKKLESLKTPEIIERIAVNKEQKSFMTQGPRKLVIWRMDAIFQFHTQLSAPLKELLMTWHPDYPTRVVAVSTDNSIRLINPLTGLILTSALAPMTPPIQNFDYQRTSTSSNLYVLIEGQEELLDLHQYDCSTNPSRHRQTWNETQWDTAVTAFAIYDYVPRVVLPEKQMKYVTNKHEQFMGAATFLICGRRDGCLSIVTIEGEMDYYAPGHKSPVSRVMIDHEMNTFISLGFEPAFRLWKIRVNQDDIFTPLLDINYKFPIKHIGMVRDTLAFVLTTMDKDKKASNVNKLVLFNTARSERYDHRTHFSHEKEVVSLSAHRELVLFCTASIDETVRVWSDKNDLVRVICLNWVPSYAGFGSPQGDIFVGIGNDLNVIPAEKYLTVIYRNRCMLNELSGGRREQPIPLNVAKTGNDTRMYIVGEDMKDSPNLPVVGFFTEPKNSQRAKDMEAIRLRNVDLQLIVEGNHPIENQVPDFHNMTKKQWDDFGKTVYDDEDQDRKFFVSDSRLACMLKMKENRGQLDSFEHII